MTELGGCLMKLVQSFEDKEKGSSMFDSVEED
jgi:hypothetical protein